MQVEKWLKLECIMKVTFKSGIFSLLEIAPLTNLEIFR